MLRNTVQLRDLPSNCADKHAALATSTVNQKLSLPLSFVSEGNYLFCFRRLNIFCFVLFCLCVLLLLLLFFF